MDTKMFPVKSYVPMGNTSIKKKGFVYMGIGVIVEKLMEYKGLMDLNAPLRSRGAVGMVPPPYAELLGFFNGGEIFVPGTVFYSLNEAILENADAVKNSYDIPDNLFIIGRTNYDAPICMEWSAPYKVLLWDDESCIAGGEWASLNDFLEEEISDYLRYLSER